MIVRIIGDSGTEACKTATEVVRRLGHAIYDDTYYYCDIAMAPLLTRKLSDEEINEPVYGTLIFHPSPLPYGRGASAIKWAYKRKEPITAATWFWATSELDAGDICEMEIVKIDYSQRPRDFYLTDILPAMARTLEWCLNNLQKGNIRRIPQHHPYATYDPSA